MLFEYRGLAVPLSHTGDRPMSVRFRLPTPLDREAAAPDRANDVPSSPDVFTPIRGQNLDLLLTDDLLAKVTMPVLLLWGAYDPNGGAAVARGFASRLPSSKLIIVPEAEHAPLAGRSGDLRLAHAIPSSPMIA